MRNYSRESRTLLALGMVSLAAGIPSANAQYPYRITPSAADAKDANPEVAPRDFKAVNDSHKIVVAVWGSGIDYNQPLLFNNIHFDLSDPAAVGVGVDFVGNDRLASNHLISTAGYPFTSLPSEEQEKISTDEDPAEHDAKSAEHDAQWACGLGVLRGADPRVGKYLGLHRIDDDNESVCDQSTLAAGLITGGQDDVGVIPYRVSPYSKSDKETLQAALGQSAVETEQFARLIADIGRSDYEGKVKIVFLANAEMTTRPDVVHSVSERADYETFVKKMKVTALRYQEEIRKHPEVLFVTYAFPSAGWTDNQSLIQYPCGLEADNLLCVGQLNERGDIAPKQQIPVNLAPEHPTHPNQGAHILFTRAQTEQTTVPSDLCPELESFAESMLSTGSATGQACKKDIVKGNWSGRWIPAAKLTKTQSDLLAEVLGKCAGADHLIGESKQLPEGVRAAAEVTRVAARYWADHPEATTGAEIISALTKQSTCERAGGLSQECTLAVPAIEWKPAITQWEKVASGR